MMSCFDLVEIEEKYWNQLESYIIQWAPTIEEEKRRLAEIEEFEETSVKY